jgi:hypothetical protein
VLDFWDSRYFPSQCKPIHTILQRLLIFTFIASLIQLRSGAMIGTHNGIASADCLQNVLGTGTTPTNTLTLTHASGSRTRGSYFGYQPRTAGGVPPTSITAQNTNLVHWVTDATAGADLGAKINAAAANGGVIAISPEISATLITTALNIPAGTSLYFPTGTFTSSVQLAFSVSNIQISGFGMGQTTLLYTGSSTAAFINIGTRTPSITAIQNILLRDMTIKGSANVTNTVFITGTHRSQFVRLSIKDATGACFHSKFAVLNTLDNVKCTNQDGAFIQQPANGIVLDQIDNSHQTTTTALINPVVEGTSGIGIWLKGAASTTSSSGTSESNGTGLQIDSASAYNTFTGLDMESNSSGNDGIDNGTSNICLNCIAVDTKGWNMGATSTRSQVIGGNVPAIVKNASATLAGGQNNCAAVGTSASPSIVSCGSAAAGHFSCATNATDATCQVNTTAVTANSEIFVFESDTTATGTALGVTCNTRTTVNPSTRLLASSVAGASFTINLGTVTTKPACFSYQIIN